jgi:hypothetical protein
MGLWDSIKSGAKRVGGVLGRVFDQTIKPAASILKDMNIPGISTLASVIDKIPNTQGLKDEVARLVKEKTGVDLGPLALKLSQ